MIIDDIIKFSENKKSKIFFNHSIKNLNWFNIGGKTRVYFQAENLLELINFLKIYNKRGKIFILGAGSNVLFKDDLYEGVVIKLGNNFKNISLLSPDTIVAGANVLDKNLSNFAKENNIGGLEFLSCIPGSVGGGIRMNAGCYQREFKDILVSVQAIDYNGKVLTFPSNKIKFSYRKSNLEKNLIFLSGTFKGKFKKCDLIDVEIKQLIKKKKSSQPSRIKTSGSTFKNPIKDSKLKVWELIKNSVPSHPSFGDATISDYHSNFFVNKNNATSTDMLNLIKFVKKKVKNKYDIDIELEVVIVE